MTPADYAIAREAIQRRLVRADELHSTYRPLLPLCCQCGAPADGERNEKSAYCAKCVVERLVKGLLPVSHGARQKRSSQVVAKE